MTVNRLAFVHSSPSESQYGYRPAEVLLELRDGESFQVWRYTIEGSEDGDLRPGLANALRYMADALHNSNGFPLVMPEKK